MPFDLTWPTRLLVFAVAGLSLPFPAAADERPNILWITCEDMSSNLGCYGDKAAVSPNIDRMAAEGVRYTHCFTVAPVCAPSRSCLITGMYPASIGSQWMRCKATLPDSVKCFPELLQSAGYYCSNNVKEDYNFTTPKTAWNESSRKAHWRNRKHGRPFFAVFNFTVTHESQIRTDEATFQKNVARVPRGRRHDPATTQPPPYHPDSPVVRGDWARYRDLVAAMDLQVGDVLKQLESDGLVENTIVFFFSDHGVGLPRGKRWLYDSGLHTPLIVRFPKKYAKLAPGDEGSTTDRLVSFVDFAPTVLSLAGVAIPPVMQGSAFLGEKAAPPRTEVYACRDRMDERYDYSRAVRDHRFKYIRNYLPQLPWAQPLEYMDEMPTMKEWRRLAAEGKLTGPASTFMAAQKPAEELYDAVADPFETINLASDSRYASDLSRLRNRLDDWTSTHMDLSLLTEAEVHFRSGTRPAYEMARDGRSFPIKRIAAAADRAQLGRATAGELLTHLNDSESAVRWWSIQGLAARKEGGASAISALESGLNDACPSVRIAAADALCRLNKFEKAAATLRGELKSASSWVRWEAVSVLDRFPTAAASFKTEVQSLRSDENDYVKRVVRHFLKGE